MTDVEIYSSVTLYVQWELRIIVHSECRHKTRNIFYIIEYIQIYVTVYYVQTLCTLAELCTDQSISFQFDSRFHLTKIRSDKDSKTNSYVRNAYTRTSYRRVATIVQPITSSFHFYGSVGIARNPMTRVLTPLWQIVLCLCFLHVQYNRSTIRDRKWTRCEETKLTRR